MRPTSAGRQGKTGSLKISHAALHVSRAHTGPRLTTIPDVQADPLCPLPSHFFGMVETVKAHVPSCPVDIGALDPLSTVLLMGLNGRLIGRCVSYSVWSRSSLPSQQIINGHMFGVAPSPAPLRFAGDQAKVLITLWPCLPPDAVHITNQSDTKDDET